MDRRSFFGRVGGASANNHKIKADSIVLCGGPFHLHIFSGDICERYAKFPPEPTKDLYGRPSICAPTPTDDGPVVYENTGKVNLMGGTIFEFRDGTGEYQGLNSVEPIYAARGDL